MAQRSPSSEGDTVQNPQRTPEPAGGTLGISRTCLPVMVSLQERHGTRSTTTINQKDGSTAVTRYVHVLSRPLMTELMTGRATE